MSTLTLAISCLTTSNLSWFRRKKKTKQKKTKTSLSGWVDFFPESKSVLSEKGVLLHSFSILLPRWGRPRAVRSPDASREDWNGNDDVHVVKFSKNKKCFCGPPACNFWSKEMLSDGEQESGRTSVRMSNPFPFPAYELTGSWRQGVLSADSPSPTPPLPLRFQQLLLTPLLPVGPVIGISMCLAVAPYAGVGYTAALLNVRCSTKTNTVCHACWGGRSRVIAIIFRSFLFIYT